MLEGVYEALRSGTEVHARIGNHAMGLRHSLSARQVEMVLAGGIIPTLRRERGR